MGRRDSRGSRSRHCPLHPGIRRRRAICGPPATAVSQGTRRSREAATGKTIVCPMMGNWFGENWEDDMARDLDAMRAWLIERISKALKVKGAMDPDAPLSKYGLQSIDAVILAIEIEEEVGVELPPTLLWEYNTANECAAYLMTRGPAIAA